MIKQIKRLFQEKYKKQQADIVKMTEHGRSDCKEEKQKSQIIQNCRYGLHNSSLAPSFLIGQKISASRLLPTEKDKIKTRNLVC